MNPFPTRGDYKNPFPEEEMDEKFRRYARMLLNDEDISEVISLGKKIEEIQNINTVIERLNSAISNTTRSR